MARLLALLCLLVAAQTASAGDTARVLFIGNSFTAANDLPETFRQLAASTSTADVVIKGVNAPGGTLLSNHCTNPQTLALIDAGGWDYVVLQEQSQAPAFPAAQFQQDVVPYAAQLSARVRQYNPCAQVVFYNTWGYKNGDAQNCPFFAPLCTYSSMDSILRVRYRFLADTNNAYHCPVGPVWRRIRTTAPGIELYSPDERHPAVEGTYAAACAFYALIFGKSPVSATYTAGINSTDAAAIRAAAKVVAFDSLTYWRALASPLPKPTAAFTRTVTGLAVQFNSGTSVGAASFRWSFGNGATSTQPNPSYTYTSPGSYVVKLVVKSSCGVSDSVQQTVQVSAAGVESSAAISGMALRPNPAGETVWLDGLRGVVQVVLLDMRGRVMHSQTVPAGNAVISLEGLPAGHYTLRVVQEGEATPVYLRLSKI